ncbi:MAG: aldo/keto reductase [Propionibacteriales bacterium]|nr:aldo/keto reductase [Propionibacteriales bacterium]
MTYLAAGDRYKTMPNRRCGRSGLKLPALSLGLWHNFGDDRPTETQRAIVRRAFDRGITHFDLANNYGPPYGAAETKFGRILREDLAPYRNELVISTKAGWDMWPGPYGDLGSRKYLLSSLDDSLRRLGLDYVDIFYSHRFDPDTPLEETIGALDSAVRQGKALYVGISSYGPERTREAAGCIAFTVLAQGLLTGKYLEGIPEDSRAVRSDTLDTSQINEETAARLRGLQEIAAGRGQSLAQMALAWALRDPRMTSLVIGASSVAQLDENLAALDNVEFGDAELNRIDEDAIDSGVDHWRTSSSS